LSKNRLEIYQNGRQQRNKIRVPLRQKWTARGYQRLSPLFFRMRPITLCICSVLLISLMAILYLSQLGQAVTTNQQIQALRNQEAALQRQNSDLINTIAQEQSPAYIAAHARKLGLAPANPQNVQVVLIPHLQSVQHQP